MHNTNQTALLHAFAWRDLKLTPGGPYQPNRRAGLVRLGQQGYETGPVPLSLFPAQSRPEGVQINDARVVLLDPRTSTHHSYVACLFPVLFLLAAGSLVLLTDVSDVSGERLIATNSEAKRKDREIEAEMTTKRNATELKACEGKARGGDANEV
jgi:hypothetical protein